MAYLSVAGGDSAPVGWDHVSGQFSGQGGGQATGEVIRGLRLALGWSQDRLAAELRRLSGRPTVSREDISRWEHGKRTPGPFWLRHLAAGLQVPLRELEAHVKRRELLKVTAAVAGSVIAGTVSYAVGEDLYSSIAAGDDGPLATVQTAHETDLMLAGLTEADRPVMLRLVRWADDGSSDVLRVNAAGILAKARSLESAGVAALSLRRDREVRLRYLRAVSVRVGTGTRRLAAELRNPRDAGARWCSAWLLGHDGSQAARHALAVALRTEPVTENVRTIALILNGDDPCM